MSLFWWVPFGKVADIAPHKLDAMRADGTTQPQILDVRTGPEWRASRIPGAVHVPITEFGSRLASLNLDPQRPIVAICLSAHRSIPAVRTLQKHGFRNACQLRGGMRAWWKEKLPTESEGSGENS